MGDGHRRASDLLEGVPVPMLAVDGKARTIGANRAAVALFGGGATMTACQAAGQDQNDGSTDENVPPNVETDDESDPSQDNVPDNTDQDDGVEQGTDGEQVYRVRKSNTGMFTQLISDARAAEFDPMYALERT